ncbi:MAG TPA: HEAT repeat domain-containing protein, partial [Nitrososphaera sp.]|nr:HEAT repeat domain-containing protein [Nitrososphaera sp.]
DDLRKIFELETGKSLQQFFDQWLYREGHPDLKVSFSQNQGITKIDIEQAQAGEPFDFSLEVKLAFARTRKTYTFRISEKQSSFQIPVDDEVEWFSVDPQFKILKTLSIKAPAEMLVKQLLEGENVIERVEAARSLKGESSDFVIDALKKAVLEEKFWGVAAEAAKTLGSIKTDYAYEALKKCLSVKHPKARRAVVRALGEFRKEETLELLKPLLQKNESYFVESEVATAIGKTRSKKAIPLLIRAAASESFQQVVAQGAIAGLKEFPGDKRIADFLMEKSKYGNHHRIREAATFALGKFADNQQIFDHLKSLLTDKWFRVRINACRALADAELSKAIPDLSWVAEHDLDHRVRRVAEECINLIRDATRKPKEVAEIREELDRIKSRNLELLQKVDRLERELR